MHALFFLNGFLQKKRASGVAALITRETHSKAQARLQKMIPPPHCIDLSTNV